MADRNPSRHSRARAGGLLLLVVVLLATLQASVGSSTAATSSTVVGATVPSATELRIDQCAPNEPGRTHFGTVLPGASVITSTDCSVAFGSSNGTSALHVRRGAPSLLDADGGNAMFAPGTGTYHPGFNEGATPGRFTNFAGNRYAMAVQDDGRILVGTSGTVRRYEFDNHAIDTSFNGSGALDFGETGTNWGAPGDAYIRAIDVQPDGKVIVAGYCGASGEGARGFCVARTASSTGGVDTAGFRAATATPGYLYDAMDDLGVGATQARQLLVQADGKLLVAGFCDEEFCAIRLNADGTYDTTFSGDGRAFHPNTGDDRAYGAVVDRDGGILLAGTCSGDFCMARLTSAGALDTGWAAGGWMIHARAGTQEARRIAWSGPGHVVLGGVCSNDLCAARYELDGDVDPAFALTAGVSGGTTDVPPSTRSNGLLVQPDGRVIVSGECGGAACAARLRANGTLDPTFTGPAGTDAGFATNLGPTSAMELVPLAHGGFAISGGNTARAFGTGGTIADFEPGTADWTSGAATGFFGICLRAVTAGVTGDWAPTNPCPSGVNGGWHALPDSWTSVARTTAPEPVPSDEFAHFNFALKVATNQVAGDYSAPIEFQVVAPG